ncbi:hypothetical protein D3C85_1630110 [compost metagenome]
MRIRKHRHAGRDEQSRRNEHRRMPEAVKEAPREGTNENNRDGVEHEEKADLLDM